MADPAACAERGSGTIAMAKADSTARRVNAVTRPGCMVCMQFRLKKVPTGRVLSPEVKSSQVKPGRFVRIVGGETLVNTHGSSENRYEAQSGKRTSAKAAAELEKEEGSFR